MDHRRHRRWNFCAQGIDERSFVLVTLTRSSEEKGTLVDSSGYFLDSPGEPLDRRPLVLSAPGPNEALVEVHACGLCHTDLSFADGSVSPRHDLPLILGHEITGRVVEAGENHRNWIGRPVLVPAVLPCGTCVFCRAGRGNACPDQKMPGNDLNGGFAQHLLAPAGALVSLEDAPDGFELDDLAVVADAVSTAYQAVLRSGLEAGDRAIVIGAGGVGAFVVQIAHALGAKVAACDIDTQRLDVVSELGAEVTLDVAGMEPRAVRKSLKKATAEWGVPSLKLRIFECSGSAPGQLLAFTLIDRASTLVQVGFTPEKVPLRLSNLMAYDATVHGTWGCPPEAYPAVLDLIYRGEVKLAPFIEHAPMSSLNRFLDDMAHHRLSRRMILHPES